MPTTTVTTRAAVLPGAVGAAGPLGGTVTSLTLGPEGRTAAWASTDRGLFRYQANRWVRVERLAQKDLRIVVELPARLLVAPSIGALLVSEDRGKNWRRSTEGLRSRYGHRVDDIRTLVRDRQNPSVLYLGAAGQGCEFVAQPDEYGRVTFTLSAPDLPHWAACGLSIPASSTQRRTGWKRLIIT